MSSIISSVADGASQTLASSLIKNFDSNGDGLFSAEEFGTFLDSYMESMTGSEAASSAEPSTATVNTLSIFSSLAGGDSTSVSSSSDTTATEATTTTTSTELPPCLGGWNRDKWTDPTHNTIKYVAGRIMAQYKCQDWLDQTKRAEIVAKFEAAGLTCTVSGKDKCDFNDGTGPIDLVARASQGGTNWHWLPINR